MRVGKSIGTICGVVGIIAGAYGQGVEWVDRYDGPGHGDDCINGLCLDSSGNIYAAGYSSEVATGATLCVWKYAPNGDLIWVRTYDGPDHNVSGSAAGMAFDPQGNLYVSGTIQIAGAPSDLCTLKYDPQGNLLWARTMDGAGHGWDYSWYNAVDPSGNVYVGADVYDGATLSVDYCTIKYAPDGSQVWLKTYDNGVPQKGVDAAAGIALDPSGNVYVTGSSVSFGTQEDYCTIKYDSNGNRLWVARYDGPGHSSDAPIAIVVDNSGNSYVTGYCDPIGDLSMDFCTVKCDTNGKQLWAKLFGRSGYRYHDGRALALDPSGNVIVAGESQGPSDYDGCVIKYDTNGNQLWLSLYDGPAYGPDGFLAAAVDGSGNTFASGEVTDLKGALGFGTVKFDPDGHQKWAQLYHGPGSGDDIPWKVAVHGGWVYVAGQSEGDGTGYDACLIKYAANPPVTVSGTVSLDLYAAVAGAAGTLEYREPGTGIVEHTSQIALNADGTYTDATAPPGTYDIACKFSHWLRRVAPSKDTASGSPVDFSLVNGDANSDNHIGLLDLAVVLADFRGSNPMADLNGNGVVGLTDLAVVLLNYGQRGDP